MESKLIVKYRRSNDRWVCPDCDAENDIGCIRCTVCGCEKTPTANILKAWNPEKERVDDPPKSKKVESDTVKPTVGGYSASGTDGEGNVAFWIAAGVAFVLVLILMS